MTKPSDFILNTDFRYLMNDGKKVLSLTIPSGKTVNLLTTNLVAERTYALESKNCVTRVLLQTSKYPNRWLPGRNMVTDVKARLHIEYPGGSEDAEDNLPISISLQRVSSAQVKVIATTEGLSGLDVGTMTTLEPVTITIKVNTFKAPW